MKTIPWVLQQKSFWWIATLAWCGLIFYLSAQSQLPGPPVGWMDYAFKKTAHMSVYAILYYCAFNAFSSKEKPAYKAALLFALLYAISDEIHQRFVPGRTSKAADVGFDLIGICGMWLKLKKRI